jgi:Spy/CpxP family protein refolding chaperone
MSIDTLRKSILVTAAALAIAVAGLLAGRVSAQAFRGRPHGDFPQRIFARMSHELDLTEDQKSRIKDVLRAHADEIKAQMQASSTARRSLHDAVMAHPTDENAIRAAATQLGQAQGDGAVLFARVRAEIDPILTEDQKARIQAFRDRVRQQSGNAAKALDNFLKSDS